MELCRCAMFYNGLYCNDSYLVGYNVWILEVGRVAILVYTHIIIYYSNIKLDYSFISYYASTHESTIFCKILYTYYVYNFITNNSIILVLLLWP